MAVLQSTSITGSLTMNSMTAGFMKVNAQGAVVMDTNTYLTGVTSGQVTGALGYTPVQPNGTGATGTWGINVSGNSQYFANNYIGQADANSIWRAGSYTFFNGTNVPGGDFGLISFPTWSSTDSNSRYNIQLGANIGGNLRYRSTNINGAASWSTMLSDANYNSYSPTLTGGGASGTWGISISGNADTVDGYHASTSTIGNYIVVRDGNGYIFGNYINMTDNSVGSGVTGVIVKQGDNYYRTGTAGAIQSFLGLGSMAYASTGSYLPISGGTLTNTLNIGTAGSANASLLNITGGTHNQVNITNGSGWGLLLGYCNEGSVSGYHGPNSAALINVQDGPLHLGTNNTPRVTVLGNGNVTFNGSIGLAVTADVRLSVNGDTHISNYLYMGGTAGSVGSWGVRALSSGGNWTVNANSFTFDNVGYGGTWSFTINSGNAQASSSMRAPIFYDSDDTGYYADFNSTGNTAMRVRGGTLYGPNPTWGRYLQVGGNGNQNTDYASVVTTDGNLHLDSRAGNAMYLNYYANGIIYLNGASYYISSNGSYYNGRSELVTINYNNDTNSTYQLLWGSGNSVYGTSQVYVNPNSDIIYARGGYVSPGNAWGTSDSAFFPNGITTAGGTNWVYGLTYLGNAPGNGSGVEVAANGRIYVRANSAAAYNGFAGAFVDRNSASSNHVPWSFENEWGNHSWGVVARFHIQQASADRPSIQFTNGTNNTRWGVGYCFADDNFRISQNIGMAPDGSSGSWGTERFRINDDGTTYLGIQGQIVYFNGAESANLYGIRGRFTNEYIHLYQKVGVGHPGGWGAGEGSTPTFGLSTYGGANFAYGNGATSTFYGHLRVTGNNNLYLDSNFGQSIVGLYSASRYQGVFAMGDAYKLSIDGTSTGSLYGLAWSHPNAGGVAGNLNTHGLLVMENGTFLAAISGSIRARDDMRAPIFYDSQNTGFYLDPNGTSNLNQLTTNTRAKWNMPRWWMSREDYTSDQNYWTGTNGWGTSVGTWANAWRGGFSGWDIWGTGTDHPQGGGYVHAQGIVSGQHLATSDGSSGYGWMMVGAGDATPNRYWLRGKWGGTTSGWVEMITTGNFTSYVNAPNAVGNGNGYYNVQNWLQVNGSHGIFWPGHYSFHIRPNITSTYTQMEIIGSKNSYGGIYDNFSAVNVAMYDSGGNGGVYREGQGRWYWYHHVGNNCTGFSTSSTSSSYRAYIGGSLYAEGDVVAYSDVRKKTDIVTIDNALEKVINLRGVYYTRIDDPARGRQTGVIAQEINQVLPEVVTYAADVDEYGVSYGNIVGVLIEAIKEQQTQIEELKNKLNALTK